MLSKVYSATTVGLEGTLVKVEIDVAGRGLPTFTIVGLPSKAIDEAKERVRSAVYNSQYQMPDSKIVVNLAPADIPKEGSSFDLPITIGILASSGIVDKHAVSGALFIGEIALDGVIQPVTGVLPIVLLAKQKGIQAVYVPHFNAQEAALIGGVDVYPVSHLNELVLHLNAIEKITPIKKIDVTKQVQPEYDHDFSFVKGQDVAKRALEIAAAGFHNVHLKGPPGTGKTLLSKTFPSILPRMDEEEIIAVSTIYSVANKSHTNALVVCRPFRSPHHTISRVGLIGGGSKLTPGEVSLAHRGVLFLDEFPEFPRSVLEALRQPLEDGVVTISRAQGAVTFPARFVLLAASNPCPCGFLGHPKKSCKCSLSQIEKYKKRISGPLLDRIDLHLDVPPVDNEKLTGDDVSEDSKAIRKRVEKARSRQRMRFEDVLVKTNGEMTPQMIKQYCTFSKEGYLLLKQAVSKLALSARSYFKIIKISQTIADISGADRIDSACVSEALQFRVKEL